MTILDLKALTSQELKLLITEATARLRVLEDKMVQWEWTTYLKDESFVLIALMDGSLHRFKEVSIPVAYVVYTRTTMENRVGKTYIVHSPPGSVVIFGGRNPPNTSVWPQETWEDILAWVHSEGATRVTLETLKACLSLEWPEDAARLDASYYLTTGE